MQDPIVLFQEWLGLAEAGSRLARPRAFCLSTVDAAGNPDARFVDLKEVTAEGFVFSTSLVARKALAIAQQPKVAMTFWWEHVERQVRVAGAAVRVSEAEADALFRGRPRGAQLTSWVSKPSAELEDVAQLERRLREAERRFADTTVVRPEDWGGYRVSPERIEFLRFQENRLHHRTLFEREGSRWRSRLLQP